MKHIPSRPMARATSTVSLLLCAFLGACDSQPESTATPKKTESSTIAQVINAVVPSSEKQFTCIIDEVNIRLDLGNIGQQQVMALPSIDAVPIAKNVLLLNATSAEDAASRIMQAKEEYRRIPPQCDIYKLSTRDAKLDTSTPLDQYIPLESSEQLVHLFYAISKLPVPYERVAQQLNPIYRAELDSFKRQDMLKTLQPEIDEKILAANGQRLLVIETTAEMTHYDQTTKSFQIKPKVISFKPSAYISLGQNMREYRLRFDAQGKEDLQYIPADENEARSLESIVTSRTIQSASPHSRATSNSRMTLKVYVQAVKAAEDGAAKDIMAKVMYVDVFDKECPTCPTSERPGNKIAHIKVY